MGTYSQPQLKFCLSLLKRISRLCNFLSRKSYKLIFGLSFSKNHLSWKNSFCFLLYFSPQFFTIFLVLQSLQLFSKACLGLSLVSHFLKFLMYFGFVCCAGLLFLMFQKSDARKMMTY